MIDKNVQLVHVHVKENEGLVGIIYRGYYMAMQGYEFYFSSERYFQHEEIRSVSPSSQVMFCVFYRY